MIRFGVIVTVVVAAVGLLVVGAVAGDLTLVYVSIALAAVALLLLIVGVAVWRDDVFASSARRDDRDLAAVGAFGHGGRAATGSGAVEGWPDRPAPLPRTGPTPGAGAGLQVGDTREFPAPVGPPPGREAPAGRDRRAGEPRPTEQLPRPADPAGRPGREVRHRERAGRDAGAGGWPGPDLTAAGLSGRDAATPDRPDRDSAPGDRSAREPAAADRAGRDTVSAPRPDRVQRYPTVTGPERFESADDPTRLAHRLDSLADLGRPVDPLTGAAGERRSAAEPVAAAPSTGRSARPTGTEQGPGDADAPRPSRTVPPVQSGDDRPQGGRDRSDNTAADSPAGSLAWPHVPAAADTWLPAEAASTAAAGVVFPASPAGAPGARDGGQATAAGSAAAPSAPAAAPPAAAAVADAVGTATASEPDAPARSGPAEPATAGTGATDGRAAAGSAIGLDDQVSVVPGIARYHKADCILIRFLSEDDLEVTSRRDAEAAGCAPCRACRPDRPSASD
jgi:hypothetical protein